ncbi:MAG: MBOAT family protein [Crocinitomicaceae bacterium]|nr:MBOAT family protein [Crocinitomicaceae bacterium]
MVFSSIYFLLYFLPIFLLVYHFIHPTYKNYWILFASIFFYAWGAPLFVFAVLGTTIVDFFIVNQIYKAPAIHKKKWLIASLVLNLGMLSYFKYANFFIDNLNAALQSMGVVTIEWTAIALPIGISFYIFQSITYAVDVYRGVNPPVKNLANYLLYILLFPQMIAGPIVKYHQISDQIAERKETIDDKLLGFYRFCIGLAKKTLVANVLAGYADQLLGGTIADASSSTIWMGIVAYTFQIYFDFSGYSDMAIGLARMMGFTFPENFNSPYLSRSITEFWRRWHMTLGAFMKEYLYIPLGGNRVKSAGRMYFNLGVVFLLSGLWHGASWNFVLWGAFHGLFLILDKMFLLQLLNKLGGVLSTIITFFIVAVGWAIFRMEDFDSMILVLKKLFAFDFSSSEFVFVDYWVVLIVAIFFSIITVFGFGKRAETYFFFQKEVSVGHQLIQFVVAMILFVLSLASITASDFNPFIYFRF